MKPDFARKSYNATEGESGWNLSRAPAQNYASRFLREKMTHRHKYYIMRTLCLHYNAD